MVLELETGLIFIIMGLLMTAFKNFFSSIMTTPKGVNSPTLKQKFGKEKASKIVFSLGVIILILGIIFLAAGLLGMDILDKRIA